MQAVKYQELLNLCERDGRSFREIMVMALETFPDARVFADEIGFSLSIVNRWSSGQSTPHNLVRAHVLDTIRTMAASHV